MGANVRIPLINSFSCRDGNAGGFFPCKDAFIYNGLVEKDNSGEYITRRPGFTNLGVLGATAVNQGLFWFNGFVYSVNNDQLIRSSGSNSGGTDGTASSFVASTTPPWGARSNAPAVVFQDRIFIIGGSLAGNPAYADVTQSQDGINWSVNAGAAPFGARQGHGVVVFQGKALSSRRAETGQRQFCSAERCRFSDDGANWTQLTIAAAFSPGWIRLRGREQRHLCAGWQHRAGDSGQRCLVSSDGITWTQAIANAPWTARSFGSYFYFRLRRRSAASLSSVGRTRPTRRSTTVGSRPTDERGCRNRPTLRYGPLANGLLHLRRADVVVRGHRLGFGDLERMGHVPMALRGRRSRCRPTGRRAPRHLQWPSAPRTPSASIATKPCG